MTFRRKSLLLPVATALFATSLVASAVTLRVANQGDALSLDPHSLNESLQLAVLENVYEPLVARDGRVLVDRAYGHKRFDTVSSDNVAAGYEGTNHLIGLGHREIVLITSAQSHVHLRDRVRGYRKALKEAGLAGRCLVGL